MSNIDKAIAAVEPYKRWKSRGRIAGDDTALCVFGQTYTPQLVVSLESELAALRSQVEELKRQLSAEQEAHAATIQREAKLALQLNNLPAIIEQAKAETQEACAAIAMEMFHAAAQGDEIADAIRARKP